jgi:urea ABC transporter permease protein UrtC
MPLRAAWTPAGVALAGAVLAVLVALPRFLSPYTTDFMRDVLIFGVFALSLDLLWGRAGILSFGQSAFFGLGAYAMGLAGTRIVSPNPTYIGVILGMVVPALLAVVLGYFLFYGGVRGTYFTILTIAVTLVLQRIALSWVELTGGNNGIFGILPFTLSLPGWSHTIASEAGLYYMALAAAVICYLFVRILAASSFGRVLTAIRDNERRTEFLGFDTSLYSLVTLVISAAIAGLAGALYASMVTFVSPELFGLAFATEVIVWVAVGGRGTLVGAFVGVLAVHTLRDQISSYNATAWPAVLGLFFLLVVFVFPRGIVDYLTTAARAVTARFSRERVAATPSQSPGNQ